MAIRFIGIPSPTIELGSIKSDYESTVVMSQTKKRISLLVLKCDEVVSNHSRIKSRYDYLQYRLYTLVYTDMLRKEYEVQKNFTLRLYTGMMGSHFVSRAKIFSRNCKGDLALSPISDDSRWIPGRKIEIR